MSHPFSRLQPRTSYYLVYNFCKYCQLPSSKKEWQFLVIGTTTLRHNGFLVFTASLLLLLLLGLLFLFPLCLLDMQPIQHRPSTTNAPWLFRHVVHAAIYNVVILLCAGFSRTFIRSVRQAFLMFGHILLLLFSTMNIL